MEYGNDLRRIGAAALVGGALGLAVVLAAVVGITVEGRWSVSRPHVLPLLLLVPMAALAGPVALTACFRVRVAGPAVQHVFLGRFVLREYPLARFVDVDNHGP